jgi:hypothetical protein
MASIKAIRIAGFTSCGFYRRARDALLGLSIIFPDKYSVQVQESVTRDVSQLHADNRLKPASFTDPPISQSLARASLLSTDSLLITSLASPSLFHFPSPTSLAFRSQPFSSTLPSTLTLQLSPGVAYIHRLTARLTPNSLALH